MGRAGPDRDRAGHAAGSVHLRRRVLLRRQRPVQGLHPGQFHARHVPDAPDPAAGQQHRRDRLPDRGPDRDRVPRRLRHRVLQSEAARNVDDGLPHEHDGAWRDHPAVELPEHRQLGTHGHDPGDFPAVPGAGLHRVPVPPGVPFLPQGAARGVADRRRRPSAVHDRRAPAHRQADHHRRDDQRHGRRVERLLLAPARDQQARAPHHSGRHHPAERHRRLQHRRGPGRRGHRGRSENPTSTRTGASGPKHAWRHPGANEQIFLSEARTAHPAQQERKSP